MKTHSLKLDIQHLHNALEGIDAVDSCTAGTLKQITYELEVAIAEAEGELPVSSSDFTKRFEQQAFGFAEKHPSVTHAIGQIINSLNSMGI